MPEPLGITAIFCSDKLAAVRGLYDALARATTLGLAPPDAVARADGADDGSEVSNDVSHKDLVS